MKRLQNCFLSWLTAGQTMSMKMKGKGAGSVQEMEEKLAQLKIQMELERQRRAELLGKKGSDGSFWRSGREGAIRGPGVKEAVRAKKTKDARPTSSDASRQETPTQDEFSPQSSFLGHEPASNKHGDYEEKTARPNARHEESSQSARPVSSTPAASKGLLEGDGSRRTSSSTQETSAHGHARESATPPMTPRAMECQTDVPPARVWQIESKSRPQSGRKLSYMEKILLSRNGGSMGVAKPPQTPVHT
jgi:hypothetical protein